MPANRPNDLQQIAQAILYVLNATPWMWLLLMFISAVVLMLIVGQPMIVWLRNKSWREGAKVDETWTVREDTPDTHQAKQGTPSMGGLGIIGVAIATYIAVSSTAFGLFYLAEPGLFRPLLSIEILALSLLPLTAVAHAALGFIDDWSKASGRGGLRARTKLMMQVLLAGGFLILWLYVMGQLTTVVLTPPIPPTRIDVITHVIKAITQPLVFAILVAVTVSTCNAVNLTDGIDGLAAGLTVQTGVALLLCGSGSVVKFDSNLFCAALAGACLGFLWFNKHPARVFMGDTGSLAIGATLGAAAVLSRAVFLLPFIAFIFYVEMFSVMLQVAYFKWTRWRTGEGRRILRRAPLHHHFELGGWSEWRVVVIFWAVNLATTVIGLVLWHKGVLPRWP